MREIVHLNYDWKYADHFNDRYIDADFDDSHFIPVMIPHTNTELPYSNFNEQLYQFTSCYRKRIRIIEKSRGKRVMLHFDGVMSYARVYLNGTAVCEHKGGYTPFKCDITEHIDYGEESILVVMVDSTERPDTPPFGRVMDYLAYGGIYREVRMELVNDIYVDNMLIKTREVLSENKLLDLELYLSNHTGKNRRLAVELSLLKEDKKVLSFTREADITSENENKLTIKQPVRGVELWDEVKPNLYKLIVSIRCGGNIVDRYESRFGFREVLFKKDGFYINGRKTKLRGLNRHQSFPYAGYAMPKSAQYKDAEILKHELGVNAVRLSHYPQSKHFLDRCDELGLFVFEEIPGWQHIGDKAWQEIAVKNVEEMIKRDWNRPSIVIWGVRINESPDNDEFYMKTNKTARDLDDTRQTGGVRNFEGSRLLEDVYTYNDFLHRGNNAALNDPGTVAKGEVPYLVTEHNGHMFPAKKFDNEARRVEQALRHLRVLDCMYMNPHISGAMGWCMFDYNTRKDFGSGDGICYHGVMDMFRLPKEAAAAYASQQDQRPVLHVASSMNIGEHDASMLDAVYVFTNCDYLKLYKNGVCIGSCYPDREAFPHMPHPPVIIRDFIGDLLEKNEGIIKKDAEKIKEVLYAFLKYGDKALPLRYKLLTGRLMLKYKMSYERAVYLYTTYVANWGCEALEYEFEGYMGDRAVIKVKKGPARTGELQVIPDRSILVEEETYDVCRVVLKHVDQNGNVLTFSNEAVKVEIEGDGKIIGPGNIALTGGSRAFWVKSAGRKGNIKVTIKSERFKTKILNFRVYKR